MTMAIAFANSDMWAANVISVKRDSQAANVMNANRISLVTSVMNANQLISIIHCVKVSLSKFLFDRERISHGPTSLKIVLVLVVTFVQILHLFHEVLVLFIELHRIHEEF